MSYKRTHNEIDIMSDKDKNNLGWFFLDCHNNETTKRGPRKQKRINQTRDKLTQEDKKALKYEDFVPVYHMWCEYYNDLVGPITKDPDDRMLKADYHGALLYVAEADNPSMVGLNGIVCLETRYTFQLITDKNKYIVIPKQGTTFQFVLSGRVFTIFGDSMRYKPSLRGKRQRLRTTLPFFLK